LKNGFCPLFFCVDVALWRSSLYGVRHLFFKNEYSSRKNHYFCYILSKIANQ